MTKVAHGTDLDKIIELLGREDTTIVYVFGNSWPRVATDGAFIVAKFLIDSYDEYNYLEFIKAYANDGQYSYIVPRPVSIPRKLINALKRSECRSIKIHGTSHNVTSLLRSVYYEAQKETCKVIYVADESEAYAAINAFRNKYNSVVNTLIIAKFHDDSYNLDELDFLWWCDAPIWYPYPIPIDELTSTEELKAILVSIKDKIYWKNYQKGV